MKLLSVALLPTAVLASQAQFQAPFQVPLQAPSHAVDDAANSVAVAALSGTVIGSVASEVESFNGIPYAAPPVGPLRLKPPQRVSKSLGEFDATGTAASCPQMPLFPDDAGEVPKQFKDAPFLQVEDIKTQEDCLTVSVRRPKGTKAGDKLPVLFGIFGGGFVNANANQHNDVVDYLLGHGADAKQPFVYVAVNYRVAGFGFLGGKEILADKASNLGLLDQRLALEWVADNIESFGGDPGKVTLWGESSGSNSVFDQMLLFNGNAQYKGKSLFHGAIMNSGGILPVEKVDSPSAQLVYDAVVEKGGCKGQKNTLKCLRELPYEKFLEASNSVPRLLSYSSPSLSYLPRPDGEILVDSPEKLAAAGNYHAVPVIIGSQADEGTVFSWNQLNITASEDLSRYLQGYFKNSNEDYITNDLLKDYPNDPTKGSPFDTGTTNLYYAQYKRLAAIIGDLLFTFPRRLATDLMAKANPEVPVWAYLSTAGHDTPFLGTSHGTATSLVRSHGFGSFYVNFLHSQDPNTGKISGLFPWPKLAGGNQIIVAQVSTFFPIGRKKDDFRSQEYESYKKSTQLGYLSL